MTTNPQGPSSSSATLWLTHEERPVCRWARVALCDDVLQAIEWLLAEPEPAPETSGAELLAAAEARVAYGHNDTCNVELGLSEPFPCSCGHERLRTAIAAAKRGAK